MKYIDLFAGVGGFHYGIDKAWDCQPQMGRKRRHLRFEGNISNCSNPDKTRPVCVYSNEWDKYAASVYRRHYGECDTRDIRTVTASDIPDFDLLCGGFPCQAFSVAGKRGGFDDTRGTLFFDIARILKEKQPRLCLLENVKGLLSHDAGRTFKVILAALTELGYDVQWQVLNSKNFGVPQNRERVYIVGHTRGTPRPQVFPIGETGNPAIFGTIQASYYKGGHEGSYVIEKQAKIRRLTPTECERLQGFPDGWTATDADGKPVSDTQRYKMMGNAVTTNVVTAVVSRLLSGVADGEGEAE